MPDIIFLSLETLYPVMVDVAQGKVDKVELAGILAGLARKLPASP